jgi:hypothetical protein
LPIHWSFSFQSAFLLIIFAEAIDSYWYCYLIADDSLRFFDAFRALFQHFFFFITISPYFIDIFSHFDYFQPLAIFISWQLLAFHGCHIISFRLYAFADD